MSNSNGSGPGPDEDRRSFTSRTPVNQNPDGVQYRRGFVTRHQVTGWRFVMRRIASGVALHDTRMLVDPLRTQSRSVMFGVLLVITGLIGCLLFSWFRPGGSAGDDPILADQSTAALYVRIGEQLHPVLNLTSARLITGRDVNPKSVKSAALDQFPRGNLVGIPGAPERMVQNTTSDADWTVCDAVSGPSAGVTVIAGPPQTDGERAADLAADHAVLVQSSSPDAAGVWLLWDGRRSPVDLADRAVTSALGIAVDAGEPRRIDPGLFNAVPQAPALAAPVIANAGQPPAFALPEPAPVGAVVSSYSADNTLQHYAVLTDGLQPISSVLATLLRNTNSFGLDQPPQLGADEVAAAPVADDIDTGNYPDRRLTVVSAASDPVTCARWTKGEGASESSLSLLSGSAVPVPDGRRPVDLVGAGSGGTANRVAMTPGSGYFVQTVGQEPGSATAESLFWVSDTGVRYGIDTEGDDTGSDTVAALGLSNPPLPIPWSALTLFAPGPTLSRGDALLAHDGIAPGFQAAPTGGN